MKSETVNIKKMVNGGYGFAHLSSGQVVLVRHVLPGEDVIVTIEETKKNYLFGKVQQILKTDRGRRPPPCDYYGHCGGCDLQHCDYPTQLNIKRAIVNDLLCRQNSDLLRDSAQLLADPLPSPQEFDYRQRIRLQVGPRGEVGFHRFHSHDIIAVDSCPLAGNSINRALTALREHEDGCRLCELSSEVELQLNPQTGKTVCIFNYSRKIRPADIASAKRFCRDTNTVDRVFFTGTDFPITGPYGHPGPKDSEPRGNRFSVHYPTITGTGQPLELSWEAGGFCQVNLEQNRQLIETVLSFCRVEKTETILDLYCGMGNFAIPLAGMATSVLGIEGQGAAIRCAKLNAVKAGLSNTGFLKSPIHSACIDLVRKENVFDCVILDPPRQGAPELAAHLAEITAKRLVYISCDPATLCRDLAGLTDNGFSISRIQPVDMFPQSHHIETVVLLEK
jgi:23S rRNA (uracil1939-C5)-methyltransferase